MKHILGAIRSLMILLALTAAAAVGACAWISRQGNAAYTEIHTGDEKRQVTERFNMPFSVQRSGEGHLAFTNDLCSKPCAQRLWFDNRFSLDTQAWSFDLDEQGRVVGKNAWASP
ncbi:hypothetical protein [Luteibacter rhizovicinus]|nr:hypothetical protein [Luteibacter rhizovicinus]